MGKIRWIINVFLIVMISVFTCDLYQIYMYSFEDFYQTSFYIPEECTEKEILDDISKAAEREKVQVFFVDNDVQGEYRTEIDIYCTEKTRDYLEQEYFVKEGLHKSLFSGNTEVEYFSWDQLDHSIRNVSPEGYYLIGEEKNIYRMREGLIDIYSGTMPVWDGSNSRSDAKVRVLFLWTFAGIIILITTYYQMSVMKKEYFIRLSLGESVWYMILKNMLTDAIFFLGSFEVCCVLIYLWNGEIYFLRYSVAALCCLLILNASVYLRLLSYDLKYSISNEKISRKLLSFNYGFKFILTILFSISIASSLVFMKGYLELKSQENYYKDKEEYTYVQLTGYDDEKMINLESRFYYTFFQEFDIQYNYRCVSIGSTDEMAVCMNKNMELYLTECIPEIRNELRAVECAILIPDSRELKDEEIASLKGDCQTLSGYHDEAVRIIRYHPSSDIIYNDVDYTYSQSRDPIIIYSGREDWSQVKGFEDCVPLLELNKTFCKVEEERLQAFCTQYQCRYMLANVYEEYQYTLARTERAFWWNLTLLFIQMVMEIFLISAIIKMEFEANRIELAIKRTLGYPEYSYMIKIYVITVFSGIASIFIFYVWNYIGKKQDMWAFGFSVGITVFVELMVTYLMYKNQEKENILKALKGGYL